MFPSRWKGGSALQEAVVDVQAGDLGAVKSAEGEEKQVERGDLLKKA